MENDDDDLYIYNYDINNKYIHELENQYFEDNNYNFAILLYDKLLENLIDNIIKSKIYSNKSACYLALKDYVNSLNYALISIKYNNKNSKAWGRIGWSFKGLKDYENSLKAFKIANKFNSSNINYKNEIFLYNSKKINKLNLFTLFKSNIYILNKLKNANFRSKLLSYMYNQNNLIKDSEVLEFINYIIYEI